MSDLTESYVSPDQLFCIGGAWLRWADMTLAQKRHKKECKLRIADASKDEALEVFWNNVRLEEI